MAEPRDWTTPEGLAELRRLDAAAHKGPWTVHRCSYVDEIGEPGVSACGLNGDSFDCSYDECHHPLALADAEFMAAARTALPQLLAALEEAEADSERREDEAQEQARLAEKEHERADAAEKRARLAEIREREALMRCIHCGGPHNPTRAAGGGDVNVLDRFCGTGPGFMVPFLCVAVPLIILAWYVGRR